MNYKNIIGCILLLISISAGAQVDNLTTLSYASNLYNNPLGLNTWPTKSLTNFKQPERDSAIMYGGVPWRERWELDFKIASVFAFVPRRANYTLQNAPGLSGGLALIGADVGYNIIDRPYQEFGFFTGFNLASKVSDVLKTSPDSTIYTNSLYLHYGAAFQFNLFDSEKANKDEKWRNIPVIRDIQLGAFVGMGYQLVSRPNAQMGIIEGIEASFSLIWDLHTSENKREYRSRKY